MIKCPNCGSTAQVEFDDYIDDFCGTIQAHYNCGCGCHFYIRHEAIGEPIVTTKEEGGSQSALENLQNVHKCGGPRSRGLRRSQNIYKLS